MSSDNFQGVEAEIRFWMEKAYQVSLGYFGALIATAALVNLDILQPLSRALSVSPETVVAIMLLLLNFAYLTLVVASVFATLKRGYYILSYSSDASDSANGAVHWEQFVRD
jgi:hypothetical protein